VHSLLFLTGKRLFEYLPGGNAILGTLKGEVVYLIEI
jgi:hypothetical protein